MPVKKLVKRFGKASKPSPRKEPLNISLPDELSVPCKDIGDFTILIYGEKKIGKTTLASMFPGCLFLMTEPGGKDLEIYQKSVNSWDEYIGYIDLLEKNKKKFKTVCIDTVDNLYEMCFEYMCKKMVIDHPHDENDFGKSWNRIKKEFKKQIQRLMQLRGFIALSHDTMKEVDTLEGKISRMVPTMSGQAEEVLVGLIDIWGHYSYNGENRILTIRGNQFLGGGTRIKRHFFTSEGGRILSIPMGDSEEESYKNLMLAYDNKQIGKGGKQEEKKVVKKKVMVKRKILRRA